MRIVNAIDSDKNLVCIYDKVSVFYNKTVSINLDEGESLLTSSVNYPSVPDASVKVSAPEGTYIIEKICNDDEYSFSSSAYDNNVLYRCTQYYVTTNFMNTTFTLYPYYYLGNDNNPYYVATMMWKITRIF